MRRVGSVTFASQLYVGYVSHRRFRPAQHHLRYRMFWVLFEVDEIDHLAKEMRCFSRNRFNLVSFFDRDHGSGDGRSVREYAEDALRSAGIQPVGGAIQLLCMPRILGYGFNPISIFFCYDREGALMAILYEVHNTFGQRHAYLVRVSDDGFLPHTHSAEKKLYVSPFMDMAMRYDFDVRMPGEKIAITIKGSDANGLLISAMLSGRRRNLTDRALVRLLVTHPLLTLKVIAAIHWNAGLLWLKGVRLRHRPAPPEAPITIVSEGGPGS
jgi:DUF1365 family protein